MQELELKKGCLNKLREETRGRSERIAHLRDEDVDCARLTPGGWAWRLRRLPGTAALEAQAGVSLELWACGLAISTGLMERPVPGNTPGPASPLLHTTASGCTWLYVAIDGGGGAGRRGRPLSWLAGWLHAGGCAEEQRYIAELRQEISAVEEELAEADAKNRLYFLLGERTRWAWLAGWGAAGWGRWLRGCWQ
jgi:hypothetical protein